MKFVSGDDFSRLLKLFVNPLLIKGVPSVIQDLKEFYTDSQKTLIIE
jgi:hypothetical protein